MQGSSVRGIKYGSTYHNKLFISRHTCGIFIGAWPCGIVTCWDELHGSEGKAQVYAIIVGTLFSYFAYNLNNTITFY